jgi:hypothetical protein
MFYLNLYDHICAVMVSVLISSVGVDRGFEHLSDQTRL